MLAWLKTTIDPSAWLASSAVTLLAGAPVAMSSPELMAEWAGISVRAVLGGLLGALIGQSFLPAASLWRGVLAVLGGVGFAAALEPHASAALMRYLDWPRLPFPTATVLGMIAPATVPIVVNGLPALWRRYVLRQEERP